MVTYNTKKLKKSIHASNHHHHKRKSETPVTMYVSLKLYSTVRSKTILGRLFHLGISIFHDTVLSIKKSLYELLPRNYVQHNIFLTTNLKNVCFVVLVKDNIDKNASSNLIKYHYHGASISLVQFPEWENQGEILNNFDYIDSVHKFKKVSPLPAEYNEAPKINHSSLPTDFYASLCTYNFIDIQNFSNIDSAKMQEYGWALQFSIPDVPNAKAWTQYHIDTNNLATPEWLDESSLLPPTRDKINTLEMQCRTMRLNIKAVKALNPGQTPVDTLDCPIYALTKEVIYHFPDKFPEYCAMFGDLHIEQCLLVVHDQLTDGSGLKEILETCSLVTIGVSAVVDVKQSEGALYCVQVVLGSLHRRLVEAAKADHSLLEPYEWLCKKAKSSTLYIVEITCKMVF